MAAWRRRIASRGARVGILASVLWSACGGDAGPTGPSSTVDVQGFPIVQTTCYSLSDGSGGPASARYFVVGLSSRVVDPSSPAPLEARMRVGERARLDLRQGPPPGSSSSCGSHNSEQWTSTNPGVASVERDPRYSFVAHVSARAPGTFTVFVDFIAGDDRRHRTTLAYCGSSYSDDFLCSAPQKIAVVTVVP